MSEKTNHDLRKFNLFSLQQKKLESEKRMTPDFFDDYF